MLRMVPGAGYYRPLVENPSRMHELSIAQALIDQVEQELRRSGQAGRVLNVEVAVGRLSGVHSESLRFAFQLLAAGTVAEGAQLEISQPLAVVRCTRCGLREETADLMASCPRCGSGDIAFEQGRDLVLRSIEIDD